MLGNPDLLEGILACREFNMFSSPGHDITSILKVEQSIGLFLDVPDQMTGL